MKTAKEIYDMIYLHMAAGGEVEYMDSPIEWVDQHKELGYKYRYVMKVQEYGDSFEIHPEASRYQIVERKYSPLFEKSEI